MNKMAGSAILLSLLFLLSCRGPENTAQDRSKKSATKAKITFIELGSVNCIPCKAMQPVMKAVEEKYGDQIEVIFYDVWKADQKKFAQKYNIRLIPTQVFLNDKGKEIFRHEGFFPETEIDALLQSHGLKSSRESKS
ncbi:MAG TPA: thioredoxin family protein [bacterium]|nr:thioredoxin family protein [bacterium]HQG45458.1 thioredoxin family protein [bacterium]HQI47905.1 thioredoxin family protein [bacterium]HQJ66331.1 thioredoxin family protein [bacterium]